MTTEPRGPELVFTASGSEYFERLQEELRQELREELERRHAIPGERTIEITAAAVEELARSQRLLFASRSSYRRSLREMIVSIYTIGGAATVLAGIFYPELREMLSSDPTRIAMVAAGGIMLLMGVLLNVFYRQRERLYRSEIDRLSRERALLEERVLERYRELHRDAPG